MVRTVFVTILLATLAAVVCTAEPAKRVTLVYSANMLGCMTPCG